MNNIHLLFLTFFFYFMAAESSNAHVQLDYPSGGETLVAGETVIIQWAILISHDQNNWDLYFSSNGGSDWVEIELDIDPARLDYVWTVPLTLTENGRIRIVQDNNGTDYQDVSADFIITDTQTSVEIEKKNEYTFKLYDNYPNPFNPTTNINYELPITNYVDLSIYNLLGQKVATLISQKQEAGYHSIEWDASNLSAGTYFIKLDAGEFTQIRKAVLLK